MFTSKIWRLDIRSGHSAAVGDQISKQPAPNGRSRKRTQGDSACQSVNDVGKPCAGEPHARFEAA
ncbi:hypothetical protein AB0P40_41555, partial [Streptomyces sp. NPDC079189]|uniref:hypothetical protein n=1 Tax=Streptomyces sp. NPDC079189 TaxID=3154514 RepID=UPI00344727DE